MPNASIVPSLLVHDAPAAVAWYQEAFGAAVAFRIGEGAGIFAMLTIGDARFFVAAEAPDLGNPSPRTLGGSSVRITLLADDPDRVHARALSAGGTLVSPVRDEEAGPRMGVLRDPFGHTWLIGAPWDPRTGS
ncbi:MAG: VOC family protein [Thermomicrobiales bacterium]